MQTSEWPPHVLAGKSSSAADPLQQQLLVGNRNRQQQQGAQPSLTPQSHQQAHGYGQIPLSHDTSSSTQHRPPSSTARQQRQATMLCAPSGAPAWLSGAAAAAATGPERSSMPAADRLRAVQELPAAFQAAFSFRWVLRDKPANSRVGACSLASHHGHRNACMCPRCPCMAWHAH